MFERGDKPPTADGNEQAAVEQLICILLQNRRFGLAKSEIGRALKKLPSSPNLLHFQAVIEAKNADCAGAYASLKQLFSISPGHAGGHEVLAWLKERDGLIDEAHRIWDRVTQLHPQEPNVIGAFAMFLVRRKRFDDARLQARRGLEIDHNHVKCLLAAAICDALEGKRISSNSSLSTLLRVYPERVETGKALMAALEMRGRNHEALEIARELLSENPGAPEIVHLVRHFRMKTHWSMAPLHPFFCLGVEIQVRLRLTLYLLACTWPFWRASLPSPAGILVLGYCGYLVLWPIVLRRLI